MSIEEFKSLAEKEIIQCRPGDWEHAKRVVKWVQILGEGIDDLELIIKAAYIHDIGWRNVVPIDQGKLSKVQLLTHEPLANRNTQPFVTQFLRSTGHNKGEIQTILSLIEAADAHKASSDFEAIIVDADSLSKTEIDHLKEKYEPSAWIELVEMWEEEFPKRFVSEKGKALYPQLLVDLRATVESLI